MPLLTRRSTLHTLSMSLLGLTLPELSARAPQGTPPQAPFVLRAADSRFAQHYRLMGFDLYLKVAGQDTQGQVSVFTGTYHKGDGPPLHVHYHQDEEFYIVAGDFLVQVGEQRYTLHAGDVVFLPRNLPHGFRVLSDTAQMLFLTQPSGTVEAFFQQISQLSSAATFEQVQQLHLAHGMRVVGPQVALG